MTYCIIFVPIFPLGPNVRLSESPNKGYIEVKNGSTWRIVDEKRWDKNRQKMLCQHLRFNETEKNDIFHKSIGSGKEIASGDLICYSTQPNGTSCCIYLEPSMSSKSIDVPHVTCGMLLVMNKGACFLKSVRM